MVTMGKNKGKKGGVWEFPAWFSEWFFQYGPTTSFFLSLLQNAYELFKTRINFPDETRLLHFFANFRVTWILTWDYTFCSKLPSPYPKYLARDFNIKWWLAYDPTLLSTDKLDSWFKEHPQQLKNIVQDQSTSQFLTSKSKIMAEFAVAGSEEEFQEKLRALSKVGHSDESNNESTTGHTPLNEDDCYGVDLSNIHQYD
ncbi:Enzymatic polyprotein [Senna tora]|uniref:Enzymatic polyprotein n=1 Tax=Senna tora TaxID=362788 RepID=A0A834XIT3_9FABA|nr:Enzymatic polyprotein [Senna tora]